MYKMNHKSLFYDDAGTEDGTGDVEAKQDERIGSDEVSRTI